MESYDHKIVLASSSPRRKELIKLLGIPIQFVTPMDKEDSPFHSERPGPYVVRMAEAKVISSSKDRSHGTIIIGSDTVVSIENMILGKPRDANHAEHMLRLLRNKEHSIYTALSILWKGERELDSRQVVTKVDMRSYSDIEIAHYIASRDAFDKAGSYAVQNVEFCPVRRLQGCYTSAVGLPLCQLVEMLNKIGIKLPNFQYKTHAELFRKCSDCLFVKSMYLPESGEPV